MTNVPRTILITGGAQGLGKGMVKHFASLGDRVWFVDVDDEAGRETQAEYAGTRFFHGDVTEPCVIDVVACALRDEGAALSALINNAGLSQFVPIEEITLEQFRRIIDVNLVAYFAWSKAMVPFLRASRGAIVNIASTRALASEPHGEAYAASKGAVVALTHALAVSLGPLVRVNAISPGWIEVRPWQKSSARQLATHSDADRNQHPVGRVGEVEDIAHLAAFLCGSQSGFITGQNYVVDGGMTRKMIYV